MRKRAFIPTLTLLLWGVPASSSAQNPVPTSQPSVLTIYREEVKYGHAALHETVEAGWPAAFAKAKSPDSYIAITSMTGPSEAWFLQPYMNWKAMGDALKRQQGDPMLAAELARLSQADAEHVNSGRVLHLTGRPDLSAGAFPNVAKIRFYEVTFMRVRPGHEGAFEELAKTYAATFKKAAPGGSYRVYQVAAGMPGPTYVIFWSAESLAAFDDVPAMDAAVMKAFTPDQLSGLQKFAREGFLNVETQRFAVNGRMSYVDDATAAQDPAFWRPGVKASQ
jgi:hypothetical protein